MENLINNIGLIVCGTACLGFILAFISCSDEKFLSRLGIGFCVGFFSAILGIFFSFIASLWVPDVNNKQQMSIASLNNNSNIEGSFFLGSGSINETEYYFFFEKLGNNSYVKNKTSSFDTIIIEDDNQTPKYVYNLQCKKNNIWVGKIFGSDFCSVVNKKLIVPKGTIIKEYILN